MRLRSLLAMTDLGLEVVTGEEELDRFVRWVVTQDLPDPSRYLSGGELVLTGMLWRSGPEDSDTFVAALARAKVAALAAGDARYGAPPEDVIEACRKYRMPLFRVPEQVSFASVTERITRLLSTGRAADLTAILDRHRQLVSGTGLGSVLELLERDLDMRCWVMTTTGRVVDGPPAGASSPEAAACVTTEGQRTRHRTQCPPPAQAVTSFLSARRLPCVIRTAQRPYSLFAVDEFGTSRAADWLLVFDSDWSDWPEQRRALAGELAAIVALERMRHDDRQSVEGRLAEELIQLIVSDAKPADIISRLELTGLGVADSYIAVAAAAEDGLRPRELRSLLREILYGASPAAGVVDGEAIALIPANISVSETIGRALDTLEPGLGGSRLSIGVSGIVDGEGLRGAVEEARYARRMAAGRGRSASLVGHDELATHMMLLASVPDEVRRMFRLRLLDPLVSYDQDNGADLVHTLTVFLQTNGSWTRSAELLHLHVNTLRYRIARIEELTGRDLSRLEDRVDFFLALALS